MKQYFRLLVLLVISAAVTTLADSPARPRSYKTPSPDGRYIFVMLAPSFAELSDVQKVGGEEAALRNQYKESGLYFNDGSTAPLWIVDWYAYEVFVSSDGVHLIRKGPWASSENDETLTFFASGKSIKSYRVKDLVDFVWLLPHSVSHFRWDDDFIYDENNKALSLTTRHKDKYRFDITTGEVISSWRPIRLLLAGAGILIVVLIFRFVRRRIGQPAT